MISIPTVKLKKITDSYNYKNKLIKQRHNYVSLEERIIPISRLGNFHKEMSKNLIYDSNYS